MSLAATEDESGVSTSAPIINDVVISVGTVNGSGSQSANMILMRSMFNMGIPVSGKNLFPSNIQGLPSWFTLRVNRDGWRAGVLGPLSPEAGNGKKKEKEERCKGSNGPARSNVSESRFSANHCGHFVVLYGLRKVGKPRASHWRQNSLAFI